MGEQVSDIGSFVTKISEDTEEKEFQEFCKGLKYLSEHTHTGGRFFLRNLKIFKRTYSKLQKEGCLVSNDLRSIVNGTDPELFMGLKKAFAEPVRDHLFRFMEEQWAWEAIRDEKLSFGNVSGYAKDDTEVEDYSRKCEKIFSEKGNREFIELARKKRRRFSKVEKTVSDRLNSSRTFISDIRQYSRACCFTEQWKSEHHWKAYAGEWKGACICFDTELRDDDNFKMVPYKMSYEPRTETDLLGQFCRLIHIDKSGKKMLDRKRPSKKEVIRFCNNTMAAMIERMFSRTDEEAVDDVEWRYLNVGKIDGREYSDDERWGCPVPGRIKYVIIGPEADVYRERIKQACEKKGRHIPYVEINSFFEIINNPDNIDLN